MVGSLARIVWLAATAAILLPGCDNPPQNPPPAPTQSAVRPGGSTAPTAQALPAGPSWKGRRIGEVAGMSTPECVVFAGRGIAYVSNIELTQPDGYWDDDNKAFIARLDGHRADALKFRTGGENARLSSPKGLTVLGDKVYAADLARVTVFDLAEPDKASVIPVSGAKGLNDAATDGKAVYVSDYLGGKLFRIEGQKVDGIPGVNEINGITFASGKLYAVTWETHEIYELDPAGKEPPKPFGLASHFKNLDGIEVLDDGTFIVSDYVAGTIFAVSPDRKSVTVVAQGLTQPADIGLDRKENVLYVPEMGANKVTIWQLEKK